MDEETLRPVARNLLRTYMVRSSRSRDLAAALMKGNLQSWSEGDKLCVEGGVSSDMFVILKGQLRVLRKRCQWRRQRVGRFRPAGDGWTNGTCRRFSSFCHLRGGLAGSGALVIDQRAFNALLEEATPAGSAFRHLLLSSMTRQLTTANQKFKILSQIWNKKRLLRRRKQ